MICNIFQHKKTNNANISSSTEFTQKEFDFFTEISKKDDHSDSTTPSSIQPQSEEGSVGPSETSRNEESSRPESVDAAKSVIFTVMHKAFSSIFKCAGPSDTLSLAESEAGMRDDLSLSDILLPESERNSVRSHPGSCLDDSKSVDEKMEPREDLKPCSSKETISEMKREDNDSLLSDVIDDESLTSFGVSTTQAAVTARSNSARLVVAAAVDGAISTIRNQSDSNYQWHLSVDESSVDDSTSSLRVECSSADGHHGSSLSEWDER